MIQAIIFDCFGVLATDGWLPYKAKYFEHDPARNKQATLLNKAVDSGTMRYDDFIREVAVLANVPEAAARRQIEANVPNEQLFAYIQELKEHYLVGLLSNAGDNWLNEIFTPEQVALFDAVALSYEFGVVKPGLRAYEIIAERLQVAPDVCVFIDDQSRYVAGAESAGMQGLLYTDVAELRQQLSGLLADS